MGERRCASSVFGALFIARALLDGVLEVSNDNFLQKNIYLSILLATIFGFTLNQNRGTLEFKQKEKKSYWQKIEQYFKRRVDTSGGILALASTRDFL